MVVVQFYPMHWYRVRGSTQPLLVLTLDNKARCGGSHMVGRTVVAAIAAVPASAQTQQQFSPGTHPPQPRRPGPPPQPHPHPGHLPHHNHPSGQVLQQPIYPQFVYPPFVGLCVVPDVGTCEVFRAPGSYCECKNWIGEVFSGIVSVEAFNRHCQMRPARPA